MGFRYRKSVKLAPGIKMNIGTKSVGVSMGNKHGGVSFNSRTGTRVRASIPGTGISYSTKIGGSGRRKSRSGGTLWSLLFSLLLVYVGFYGLFTDPEFLWIAIFCIIGGLIMLAYFLTPLIILLFALFSKDKATSRTEPNNISSDDSNAMAHSNPDLISQCSQRFIVFDLETTGFSHNTDRIIEISAVIFENFQPVSSFSTLVNPHRHIPSSSAKVHGITDTDVKNAPDESSAITDFCSFIGDSALNGLVPLVAHNAPFDHRFICSAFERCGITANLNVIDTLNMSREHFPELPNHKLGTVSDHLNISLENAHRAEYDALACGQVFIYCLTGSISPISKPAPPFSSNSPVPVKESHTPTTETLDDILSDLSWLD